MPVHKLYVIFCDKCHERYKKMDKEINYTIANALNDGWEFRKGMKEPFYYNYIIICPECKENGN